MRIVGIDPGTHRIGYSCVSGDRYHPEIITIETIEFPRGKTQPGERLRWLSDALERRLRRDRPDAVATEKLFFTKNAKTALSVSEARGVILLTAHKHVRTIWEYTPSEAKHAIAGFGRANKKEIEKMIRLSFPTIPRKTGDDAIDALALALTGLYCGR